LPNYCNAIIYKLKLFIETIMIRGGGKPRELNQITKLDPDWLYDNRIIS